MRRSITRAAAAVTAGVALSALGVTGLATAGADTQAPRQRTAAAHMLAVPGARLWVQRYTYDGGDQNNIGKALAISPDGSKVYVTGSATWSDNEGYATIAYSAATGAQLWAARYQEPPGTARATSVAVSPDGARVYVTGQNDSATESESDYATIAYDAATGTLLWIARYSGPSTGHDGATALAVSPDGGQVYVTGWSHGIASGTDYATIAYNAATGTQKWAARYGRNGDDGATSLALSPDGRKVYVTGYSPGTTSRNDYATIAYSAATGTRLWVQRHNGPANSWDSAAAVAASPDGRKVYVTGRSYGKGTRQDYATIAYSAATGARLWAARYNGPGNSNDQAAALAVSPAGTVLVTGVSNGTTSAADYATIAYSPAGARLWTARYNGPANGGDAASSVAAPGNGKVYVTGWSRGRTTRRDYATIACNVFTGARLWADRYHGDDTDGATAVAARAGRVFVTGALGHDYYMFNEIATVAYKG